MSEAIDLLTITYQEDDLELVKEIDKKILSKGAWVTILYSYKEWDKKKESYGDKKFSIRRYQKSGDNYMPRSKFNISSVKQAKKLIDFLQELLEEDLDQ
ncbi:hypothetical protein AB834_06015 [PVC group bacterium (ex Bugula neritina AB1)]|nr:hypothetical protein AB834_06015 [PVC group bacterium (ex Bugula neritina AB1)]